MTRSCTVYVLFILLPVFAYSTYVLKEEFTPNNFADHFTFIEKSDKTGFANYVNQETAQQTGLYKVDNGKLYIGVDHENKSTNVGRNSVRLESKSTYQLGLFIFDLQHMPSAVCGSWPAYWFVGPNWPDNGEMDIIEGESTQKRNFVTMHTGDGCKINRYGNFTGSVVTDNCFDRAPWQPPNKGCSVEAPNENTYGDGFNKAGGGVYALEWTDDLIQVWHFPRSEIPEDITSGQPNPTNWPAPIALFSKPCKINEHFVDQRIILNINFCGGWVDSMWVFQCLTKGLTCKDFVEKHPETFKDVYWLINYLRIYEKSNKTSWMKKKKEPVRARVG